MFVQLTHRRISHAIWCGITVGALPICVSAQGVSSLTLNAIDPCGKTPSATVHLNAPAPVNGLTVQLSSSFPANASVPASVQVKSGTSQAEFQINCVPATQAIAATITASVTGQPTTASAVLNILAPVLNQITVPAHTGGKSVEGKVFLLGKAPAGGVVVTLSSNSTKAVVPAFVTVPENSTNIAFQIQTRSVAQVTNASIIGTGLGVTKTVDLAIQPPRPVAIGFTNGTKVNPVTISPTKSVEGSEKAHVRILLGNEAPCCNFPIQLTSSNPAVATVPATAIAPNDSLFADFQVTTIPVRQAASATITATTGSVSVSAVITVLPPRLVGFTLLPTTVIGGQNSQGKLQYFNPAPVGGIDVMLSSSNGELVAPPKQLTVPAGATELVFPIETNVLETRATVTVSVNADGQKKTAQLELVPEGPSAVTITPNPMIGGTSTKAFVEASNSTDAFVVQLKSSAPGVVDVPASVSFTPGATRREFLLSAAAVPKDTTVTISATTTSTNATKGNPGTFAARSATFTVTRTASVKISAPVITAMSIDASSVVGGANTTGRVTLSGKAPAGGFLITTDSDNFSAARITGTVRVPAGEISVAFTVTTSTVSADADVRFTARANTSPFLQDAMLRVKRP